MASYKVNSRWRQYTQGLRTDRGKVADSLGDAERLRRLIDEYRAATFGYIGWYVEFYKIADGLIAAKDIQEHVWREITHRMTEKLAGKWAGGTIGFRDLLVASVHEACLAWSKPATRRLIRGEVEERDAMANQMRRVVLERAWTRLEAYQRNHRNNYTYFMLRIWDNHRGEPQESVRLRLTRLIRAEIAPDAFRQAYRRGRTRLAEYLISEVEGIAKAEGGPSARGLVEECERLDLVEDYLAGTACWQEEVLDLGPPPSDGQVAG